MTARTVIIAFAGTVLLVFAVPYALAAFGLALNGTETLLLVAVLWAACWGAGRVTIRRRARTMTRQ